MALFSSSDAWTMRGNAAVVQARGLGFADLSKGIDRMADDGIWPTATPVEAGFQADLVYPVRMNLARLGEETISLDISDDDTKAITLMLDYAFSPFVSIVMAFITPVVGILAIPKFVFAALSKGPLPLVSVDLAQRRMKIFGFFLVSVCAANPIFGLLLMLEILLFFTMAMFFLGPTALARVFLSLANSETKFLSSFSDFIWSGRSSQA